MVTTREPYCGTRELTDRVHDRVSDRERRDIITALQGIAYFEDDDTGEERCEISDVIDALDVHTDIDWTINRDEVERLIDMVNVPQTGPKRYRLNKDALREWMARTHTTQNRLAKMVGVTACMPSQWLNGASEPRTSTMLNLAEVTGMSIYDLMEVDDGNR